MPLLASTCLAPNEQICGDTDAAETTADTLTVARSVARLDHDHPDLVFSLLHWVVGGWTDTPAQVFRTGLPTMTERYRALGLSAILPPDRVLVAVRPRLPWLFGGFHYPGQGYRHVQMAAVVTTYGALSGPSEPGATLRALDLLRSYAHDCLHYGSFREYTTHRGELVRVRYGPNWRYFDGSTYSAPDSAEARSTRNLGIVMEGAADRESRAVALATARHLGLTEPAEPIDGIVFRETTGQLTDSDRAMLAEQIHPTSRTRPDIERYLAAMAAYTRTVNDRYDAFLTEIGGTERDALHALTVAAMVSGRVEELCRWLDQRHGPRTFERLFRRGQREIRMSVPSAAYRKSRPASVH